MRTVSLRAGLGLLLLAAAVSFTACEGPEVSPSGGPGGHGGCGTPAGPPTTSTTGGAS